MLPVSDLEEEQKEQFSGKRGGALTGYEVSGAQLCGVRGGPALGLLTD